MSSYFSGSNGALEIGGKRVGKVQNWSMSTSLTTLDTTSLADTDSSSIAGTRSTSGAFRLFYYSDSSTTEVIYAKAVIDSLIKAQTTATEPGQAAEHQPFLLTVKVNDGSANGKYIKANVLLTSVAMSMAVGSVFSADCAYQVVGAPQEVSI